MIMKDYGRKVKVSDLLRNPGKEDVLDFEKKFLTDNSIITDDGIAGSMIIKALDRYSVLVSIENLKADVKSISDISGKEFIQTLVNPFYEALFIIPQDEKKHIRGKDEADEYFIINQKDESIDVSEAIQDALTAVTPVVSKMEGESLSEGGEDVESDYDHYT